MNNNLLNLDNIENLDSAQIFEMSLKHVEQFSVDELLEFLNENILKLDFMLDSYHEATSMTPSDALAHINISKSLQSFCLIEHWIKTHLSEKDNSNDLTIEDLEQDDEL